MSQTCHNHNQCFSKVGVGSGEVPARSELVAVKCVTATVLSELASGLLTAGGWTGVYVWGLAVGLPFEEVCCL